MSSTPEEHSEPNATLKTQAKPEKQASSPAVNKFAEARLAKKKQRRRAHRATIRRPNTNG
jgi:hypothetical protein